VRRKWDKGFNDLIVLERIDDDVCITRYMTNSIALISARDFVDARYALHNITTAKLAVICEYKLTALIGMSN